jgi:uncharacterized protein YbcV (DUF1398 family)
METLEWLSDNSRYTKQFANYVGKLCRDMTNKAVAETLNLHQDTVKDLDKIYMKQMLEKIPILAPSVIGIDELSIRKGHTYRIIVSELATSSDRYRSPGDFVQFANKLMALGVIRQTYDVLNDDLSFYSKDAMLYHFSASEIDKSIYKNAFHSGEAFDLDKLKKAIENLDSKKISAVEFHQEIAQAGIAYVSVFLKQRKIYYLSQDGKYFLERY